MEGAEEADETEQSRVTTELAELAEEHSGGGRQRRMGYSVRNFAAGRGLRMRLVSCFRSGTLKLMSRPTG